MIPVHHCDVLIFGGGIAGLWSLARLRQAGYSALLLESQALGGTQTLAAQGIIHGGIKYALGGHLTRSAQAIQAMPDLWRACLAGTGELDLSAVMQLSDHQYLWSSGSLASELAGLFASYALRARVFPVPVTERPLPLQDRHFNGQVYRLHEPVLDIESLIAVLIRLGNDACLRVDAAQGLRFLEGTPPLVELQDTDAGCLHLRAQHLLFTAGAGNARLLAILGRALPAAQHRPLHMLMLRGPLPALYAHCLGAAANPRLTITYHPTTMGDGIWYLGGQLAETGVQRTTREQITAGQQELRELLPGLNITTCRWDSLRVERAESRQPRGRRPDQPFLHTQDGVSVAWPTKLAFAPLLANKFLATLRMHGVLPIKNATVPVLNWPRPPRGLRPWQALETTP